MNGNAEEQERVVCFLLDGLGDEERADIEERLLADPCYFEFVLSVEKDLFAAYKEGRLSPERRMKFENTLLVKAGVTRKANNDRAESIRRAKDDESTGQGTGLTRWFRAHSFAFACALSAIGFVSLLSGAWLAFLTRRAASTLQTELAAERSRHAEGVKLLQQANEIQGQLERQLKAAQTPIALAFFLLPGTTRGELAAASHRLKCPPGAEIVELRLAISSAIPPGRYRAALLDAERVEVASHELNLGVPAQAGGVAIFQVPGNLLKPGHYTLELQMPSYPYKVYDSYSFQVLP